MKKIIKTSFIILFGVISILNFTNIANAQTEIVNDYITNVRYYDDGNFVKLEFEVIQTFQYVWQYSAGMDIIDMADWGMDNYPYVSEFQTDYTGEPNQDTLGFLREQDYTELQNLYGSPDGTQYIATFEAGNVYDVYLGHTCPTSNIGCYPSTSAIETGGNMITDYFVKIEDTNGNSDYVYWSEYVEEIYGCTDPMAINYNPEATIDDGSCQYEEEIYGCTDPMAINYNPEATIDDGSCQYGEPTGGIVDIDNGFTGGIMALVSSAFSGISPIIILAIGLPLGFWFIRKVIAMIRVEK